MLTHKITKKKDLYKCEVLDGKLVDIKVRENILNYTYIVTICYGRVDLSVAAL